MDDVPPISENANRAAALRKAVYKAYAALRKAYVAYEQALAIVLDTELGSDGWLALQRQRREYRNAVSLFESHRFLAQLYGTGQSRRNSFTCKPSPFERTYRIRPPSYRAGTNISRFIHR